MLQVIPFLWALRKMCVTKKIPHQELGGILIFYGVFVFLNIMGINNNLDILQGNRPAFLFFLFFSSVIEAFFQLKLGFLDTVSLKWRRVILNEFVFFLFSKPFDNAGVYSEPSRTFEMELSLTSFIPQQQRIQMQPNFMTDSIRTFIHTKHNGDNKIKNFIILIVHKANNYTCTKDATQTT